MVLVRVWQCKNAVLPEHGCIERALSVSFSADMSQTGRRFKIVFVDQQQAFYGNIYCSGLEP